MNYYNNDKSDWELGLEEFEATFNEFISECTFETIEELEAAYSDLLLDIEAYSEQPNWDKREATVAYTEYKARLIINK